MIKFHADDISRFAVLPRDAGQIVEISYAMAPHDGYLIQRTDDRSTGSVSMQCARLDDNDSDSRFEPQNGRLPEIWDEWETCTVD